MKLTEHNVKRVIKQALVDGIITNVQKIKYLNDISNESEFGPRNMIHIKICDELRRAYARCDKDLPKTF